MLRTPRAEHRRSPLTARSWRGARAIPIALGVFGVFAVLASSAGAEPTRILDLLTFGTPAGELTRIYGSSGDGAKGVPVAGGGDLDDDGFPDTAFSAVQADPLGVDGAGETIVVFGDGTLGGSVTTADLSPGLLKIAGQQVMEVAGVEIEIADVTGDDVGDLLIGHQNYSPDLVTRPGAGALTIIVGGPELRDYAETEAYLVLGTPTDLTVVTFVGANAYDRFGIWMRAGDVDGDGIKDIAVGADEVDETPGMATVAQNNGAVYVIRGGAHLDADLTIDLATFGTMTFPAALAGHVALLEPPTVPSSLDYHFGATCQIGDLDGDGKGEVIAAAALNRSNAGLKLAGAPVGTGEASGGSADGTVFIAWDDLFPTTAWASGYTVALTAAESHATRIEGAVSMPNNSELGEELLAGLDYDGDGAEDLFLGDLVGDGGNGSVSGTGHVIYNVAPLKGLEVTISGLISAPPAGVRHTLILGPTSSIGGDTAIHADYDGDGLGDLAFCNPKEGLLGRVSAGNVHVIYGEVDGWPAVIDLEPAGVPSPEVVRIVEIQGAFGSAGGNGGDTLCYSAAGGDVDDDGVPDLLINEMEGDGFAPDGPDDGSELDPAPDVGNLLVIGGAPLLERVLLDVDGDGVARPLTDGVLIARHLSGFTGDALLDGAVGDEATRTGPEIEEYLARSGAALDADADDAVEPETDGALMIRYLFGLSGDKLVEGALGGDADRTDPADVAAFLDRLKPL